MSEHSEYFFSLHNQYYLEKFKLKCLEANGEDFQKLFEEIMLKAKPGFRRSGTDGNIGDLKCDGRYESTFYQVYSPYELNRTKLTEKIEKDLDGAVQIWQEELKTWVFVCNNRRRGCKPIINKLLDKKRKQYENISIEYISDDELWELASKLEKADKDSIFGPPPDYHGNASIDSDADLIDSLSAQDSYSPPISKDEFLNLLSECSNRSEYLTQKSKISLFDKIAFYAWEMIVDRLDYEVAVKILDNENNYIRDRSVYNLIYPLCKITVNKILSPSEINKFFFIGETDEEFRPKIYSLKGCAKFLRRVIIFLLYSSPEILITVEVFEKIQELALKGNLYWTEFFADLRLRHTCGNLKLDPQLLNVIDLVCGQYRSNTDNIEKPIVKLWSVIESPLEGYEQYDQDKLLELLKKCAVSSRNIIECKWCIAAALRILPLYDSNEDNNVNDYENVEKESNILKIFDSFNKALYGKSPQLQFMYLKELLKYFIYTKNQKYLSKYTQRFTQIQEIFSHPSRSHLQLEYACCLYVYYQTQPIKGLPFGELVYNKSDLLKHPLLKNHSLNYVDYQFTDYPDRNNDADENKRLIRRFFIKYISFLYEEYARKLIESNHIRIREFPCLTYSGIAKSLKKRNDDKRTVQESVLLSLKKFISLGENLDPSFYAKSIIVFQH